MVVLKSKREIEIMKSAGRIAANALKLAGKSVKPGISTLELDEIIKNYIIKERAVPSFYDYGGFPGNSCISVNNVVIHGIPSKNLILKSGDIVSIDVGAYYKGFHGDTAWTFKCSEVGEDVQNLLDATRGALERGIEKAVIGNRIGNISQAVQDFVESRNCSVVTDFVGHGVGTELHEDPIVPNYGKKGTGSKLLEGLVIAIEPMVVMGDSGDVKVLDDEWTTVSVSGKFAAHFEKTVAITKDGPVILTTAG